MGLLKNFWKIVLWGHYQTKTFEQKVNLGLAMTYAMSSWFIVGSIIYYEFTKKKVDPEYVDPESLQDPGKTVEVLKTEEEGPSEKPVIVENTAMEKFFKLYFGFESFNRNSFGK